MSLRSRREQDPHSYYAAGAVKVCIVGASGKLVQYMVQHALDRGYAVVGVCREQSVAPAIVGRQTPSALAHAASE
jgi:uncharacterized protein YbjT (DUF2867 family)